MTLLYAGIDEAGYGPMLGPLCVGAAVLRVDGWDPGDPPPDVWELVETGACRTAREARDGRVAVADSKKLKLPNKGGKRHPLTHLERGVLTHLSAAGHNPRTDLDLFDTVGAALDAQPWFGGVPAELPVAGDVNEIRIAANVLRRALGGAGVGVVDLACRTLGVRAFNDVVRRQGTKGATTGMLLVDLLRNLHERCGEEGAHLRIACDRQGGRTGYRGVLAAAWPDAEIEVVEQSPRVSCYRVVGVASEPIGVQFLPEAETRHYPVALASMLAKLVREMTMARFNAYWTGRMPELKPTAGYVTDARRWLREAKLELVGVDPDVLIRIA